MATTLQIVQRIRDILTDSGSRETFTDDLIIRTALNPIAREIAVLTLTESDSTTVSTVGGQRSYSLPTAIVPFVKISSVTYGTTRRPLLWLDIGEMAQITSTGEPEYWSIYNNQLHFAPTPSGGDTVYIDAYNAADVANEQDPAASTDEFGFTADVEDCLVWGCASLLSAINREPERERSFGEKYLSKVAQLRRKLQPDDFVPAQIKDNDSSDADFYHF